MILTSELKGCEWSAASPWYTPNTLGWVAQQPVWTLWRKENLLILPSSGLLRLIGPIFKSQASWTAVHEALLLKIGPIDNPETSALNQSTLRNYPEDERIQFNGGGSLRSRKKYLAHAEILTWFLRSPGLALTALPPTAYVYPLRAMEKYGACYPDCACKSEQTDKLF